MLTSNLVYEIQSRTYLKLNNFSKEHKFIGRFLSLPVSILDVLCEAIKNPLSIIEYIALSKINLIGAAFSNKKYTFKKTIIFSEMALMALVTIPVSIAFIPVRIIHQIFVIIINPELAESITTTEEDLGIKF